MVTVAFSSLNHPTTIRRSVWRTSTSHQQRHRHQYCVQGCLKDLAVTQSVWTKLLSKVRRSRMSAEIAKCINMLRMSECYGRWWALHSERHCKEPTTTTLNLPLYVLMADVESYCKDR